MAKAAKTAPKKAAKKSPTKTAKKAVKSDVKLGNPTKTAELIDVEINDFLKEVKDFTEKGNKSAAGRARKHAQTAIKYLRTVRKEIQAKKNSGK